MTTHEHQYADTERPALASGKVPSSLLSGRPRWLVPAAAGIVVAGVLVVTGVVALSTVLYLAAFGGMIAMHFGGHGHGAHGGGHGGHEAGATQSSGGTQSSGITDDENGQRVADAPPSRGCH